VSESDQILNSKSAQLGYIVSFTSVHAQTANCVCKSDQIIESLYKVKIRTTGRQNMTTVTLDVAEVKRTNT